MNKKLLLATTVFIYSQLASAQVLYAENFDNLTIGNLTTDFTGQTPGQGGLYGMSHATIPYSAIQIKAEPNKGNVLDMDTDTYSKWGRMVEKRNLDIPFNQRTPGNDLLKFQFDFYTGDPIPISSMEDQFIDFQILSVKNYLLGGFRFYGDSKKLWGVVPYGYNSGFIEKQLGVTYRKDLVLPPNQWVTLAVTIDFKKAKIYFEIPHLGIVYEYKSLPYKFTDPMSPDEPNTNGIPNLLRIIQVRILPDVGPRTVHFKYDNFNITAVNKVPTPTVGIEDLLSNSFNLFPNPASNIINITNSDNHLVQNITIYDTTGKLLKTQDFNNENNVLLNIESLANGMYLLHIHTNNGIAVKKIIKN